MKLFIIANIAIFLLALVINLFAWKFQLVSAGISGYGLVLSYLVHINVGIVLFVMNGFIMLLNWLILGKIAGIKAIWGYIAFSVWISVTQVIFHLHQTPTHSFFYQLMYLSILAILIDILISIIIASSYSVGSYSALYPVINKFIPISPSRMFIIGDVILTIITALLFGYQKAFLLLIHAIILSLSLKYTMPVVQKILKSK
ncbi:MAG TPA: YitT family protein [Candidatus Saccharimonadales bacterium]|nr:YitT family protein [Candidatus Saccharimonadales bacterium]